MDYWILLKKLPRNNSSFWHSLLQVLGDGEVEGAGVKLCYKLLGYALSAVSTYKAT